MSLKPPVVAICVPIRDRVTNQFRISHQELWIPGPHSNVFNHEGKTHYLEVVGRLVADARTELTMGALSDPSITHLLWVDDDMSFPPHSLKQLLGYDQPIVGGLCHSRRHPYPPVLCRRHWQAADRGYGYCYDYPQQSLFEVDATGAAFLLIKRQVFEDISSKFGYGQWWVPQTKPEDISFCERAKACGYRIFVDTGLEIGHIAGDEITIDALYSKRNREYKVEEWLPDPGLIDGIPEVSIIIPTYNQLPEFLTSAVISASHQTVPVEVIVVDDGSTITVVPDPKTWPTNVKVIRHDKNQGIAATLNTGIDNMSTDWFCWLSSDDLINPNKVEIQLKALLKNKALASFHSYESITQHGLNQIILSAEWQQNQQMEYLSQACCINGSTIMVHKSIIDKVGKFDTNYKYGQDWEFFCRVGEETYWLPIKDVLGIRREFGNLTEQIKNSPKEDIKRIIRDKEDQQIRDKYKIKSPAIINKKKDDKEYKFKVLAVAEFDPAGVLFEHRKVLRTAGVDYRLALRDLYPIYTGDQVPDYLESTADREDLVNFAKEADIIQFHPAISQPLYYISLDPYFDDAENVGFCGINWRSPDFSKAKRISYFHGSRNAAYNSEIYEKYWRNRGHSIWASTLDYVNWMGATYAPPIVSIKQTNTAILRNDSTRLIISQAPTDPENCNTVDLLYLCEKLNIPTIIIRNHKHEHCLTLKTTSNAGFDHLRGSFSVNTIENCKLGLVPLVGVKKEYLNNLIKEINSHPGITNSLFGYIENVKNLEDVLIQLKDNPELTRTLQSTAKYWADTYWSKEAITNVLLSKYRQVLEL